MRSLVELMYAWGKYSDVMSGGWQSAGIKFQDCQGEQNLRCFPFETLLSQLEPRSVLTLQQMRHSCTLG